MSDNPKQSAKQLQSASYADLVAELQAVLDWFQAADVSVEQATAQYETGLRLIAELEARLAKTEAEITQIAQQSTV